MALITLDAFIKKTKGKAWANYTGTYKGQCVSLVSQYLNLCYGLKPGAWGNAIDYRKGGSGGNQLEKAGFKWYPAGTPAIDGDILVWGDDPGTWTGVYGHIAIWSKGRIYNQNYGGRLTADYNDFFTPGYLGKWRKARPAEQPAPKPTPPATKPTPEPAKPAKPTPTPVEPEKPVEAKPEPSPELPLEPDETAAPVPPEVIPPSTEPYDGFEHVTKQGVVATVIAFIIFVLTLIGIRLGGN